MSGPRDFRPAWWLPGGHLQTLWASLLRRAPRLRLRRELLELPDGDQLELCWSGAGAGPIVLVLHGLEGSVRSPYAAAILAAIARCGWRGALMHFRGCGGSLNRLPRSYHSGDTGDLGWVLERLARREPDTAMAAVGYSLGGNALLKYLGEQGDRSPLQAAVTVSVPFVLDDCARRLERGLSRIYQHYLIGSLRAKTEAKFRVLDAPVPLPPLETLRSFRAFDDAVTAPIHGFRDVDDYYERSSSRPYLGRIRVPTLILHARDDPFMTPACVPAPGELADCVDLELYPGGGHVGFVAGRIPGLARYWLEPRITDFLGERLG